MSHKTCNWIAAGKFAQCSAGIALMLGIFFGSAFQALAAPLGRPNYATVYVSGNINTQTWTSDNVYVVQGDAVVPSGQTLTIQANTIVKFMGVQAPYYLGGSLSINGALVLESTSLDDAVIFTSYRDDSAGGDTNGDGNDTTPAPGDWQHLQLTNNLTEFRYAKVSYAWRGVKILNTSVSDISPYVHHNIFYQNKHGILLETGSIANITSTIENNFFTYNEFGLKTYQQDNKLGTSLPLVQSNEFNNSTILPIYLAGSAFPTYVSNTFKGYPTDSQSLGIGLGGNVTYSGTLPQVSGAPGLAGTLPYVVLGRDPATPTGELNIANGYTLNLPLNTIIKFTTGRKLLVRGVLTSEATPANRAIFTSFRDDVGGDTNGDGTDFEPMPEDWDRIHFINKDITFENAIVRYAQTSVYYENNELLTRTQVIRNCVFEDNVRTLHFKAADNADSRNEPQITNNTFTDNTGFPIWLENTSFPHYSGNIFKKETMLPPTRLPRPGIYLLGNWYTSGTWESVLGIDNILMPYVAESTINIRPNATITVPASSVFKLRGAGAKIVVDGALSMLSTPSSKIIFTSINDDSVLFDTYGDGSTIGAKGDWKGVVLRNSASEFHDAIVKYAGEGLNLENLTANNLNPGINGCLFQENTTGVLLDIRSSGNITSLILGNTFTLNDFGLKTSAQEPSTGSSLPTLQNNSFIGQTKYPIYLSGTANPVYLSNSFTNNTNRGIALGGWFGNNATLTAVPGDSNSPFSGKNFPYAVIEDLKIGSAAVPTPILTIPASTVIKGGMGKKIEVRGGLLLQSTPVPAQHIFFTSIRDDSYDDTNADGSATSPARSDWEGLYLFSNRTATFEYVDFRYAKEGLVLLRDGTELENFNILVNQNLFTQNNKAIILRIKSSYNNVPLISNNSIFSNNFGIVMNSDTSTAARYSGCNLPTLQNNVITGHAEFPIFLNGSSDPTYLGNTFSSNAHPAIALSGYWACNATWTSVVGDNGQVFPYVVFNDWLTQDFGSTINIPAGTVIKFDKDLGIYGWGKFNFQSTPANKIILTSYKDDRYKGDTNGDGNASSPGRSDWKTFWLCDFPANANHAHDIVAHFGVAALGVYYNGPINTSVSTQLSNIRFEDNHSGLLLAVRHQGDIAAQIQDVTFINNKYGLLTFAHPNSTGINRPVLTRVRFEENDEYPIYLGGTAFPSYVDTVIVESEPKTITAHSRDKLEDDPENTFSSPLELSLEGEQLPDVIAAYQELEKSGKAESLNVSSPANDLTFDAYGPRIALAGAWNNAGELAAIDGVYVLPGNFPVSLLIDGIATTVANDMTIGSVNAANSRVTFYGDAVLKFGMGRQMIVNGGLNLMSTANSRVTFTSIRDDSIGGDTNRNGDANQPAKGDWVGVKLTSSATHFRYSVMRYAAEGLHIFTEGLINQNISPEVSESIFANNMAGVTLWAANAADILSPEGGTGIHHNQFLNNNTHILGHINQKPNGSPSTGRLMVDIHYNDFLAPTNFGINNLSTNHDINALNNYWGHSTGPYNASRNPGGKGVPVSLRVNFNPWAQTPFYSGSTSSIHGRVTKPNLADPQPGIPGVTLTLLPGNYTTTTNQEGYYSFHNLPRGVYTVIPSLSGWLFGPSQFRVDLVADAEVNFIGVLGASDYFLTVSNVNVVQPLSGTTTAVFKIRLSKAASFPVVVEYFTADGTATAAGNDYVPITLRQMTFNVGEVEKQVAVTVRSGPINEAVEYFKLVLQNPVPAATVKLLPGGEFGVCTIIPPSNFVYIPMIRK